MESRPTLELIDAADPRVERTWRSLETRSQPAFFLSWGWTESWLASLPKDERPQLVLIARDGEPSAAFFLGRQRVRRHVVMGSNALYFNATGSPRHDELCIEHNGLLAAPGVSRSLAALLELLTAALPARWDNALAGHAIYDLLAGDSRYKQNLATGAACMVWLRVQRPLARFTIEDHVRRWKHALLGPPQTLALRAS